VLLLNWLHIDADEKVLDLMHTVVRIQAPSWYISPEFKHIDR